MTVNVSATRENGRNYQIKTLIEGTLIEGNGQSHGVMREAP